MRAYLSPGMRSALLSTVVYFTFVSVQPIFSQAKTAAGPPAAVDSEQISRLNEKVAAQDQQLAAQQAQINALESGLAEQKALIGKLLQAVPQPTQVALSSEPHLEDASLLAAQVTALRGRPPAAYESGVVKQTQTTVQGPPQTTVQANALTNEQKEQPFPKEPKHWYDKYSERGYMQFREDNVVNTNSKYTCDQCDKGIGPNNTFFLRRMRLVISGNITDHISFYLQPDFASSSGSSLNYAQLRDAYFDAAIDKEKTNRFRVGQSKIPYGFENLQSSQNRLDLDRDDALNSAQTNERDLGIFYYWAKPYLRERFAELVSSGLKGSGDYGSFALGMYNGTGPNVSSNNRFFHYISRYTYPFKMRNGQFIETSIQGYIGKYTLPSVSSSTITNGDLTYNDQRIAGSLIIYPQPLGFQTEFNVGTGPQYNPATKTVDQKALQGGYALLNYRYIPGWGRGVIFIPYSRFTYYDGGKKFELDARKYRVLEGDVGIEIQFSKAFEFTPQYQNGYRLFEDGGKPNNEQRGSLLRMQLQFNY